MKENSDHKGPSYMQRKILLSILMFIIAMPLLSQTPDFSVSASPPSQELPAPSGVSFTVTVTPSYGFTDTVNMSLDTSSLPSTATASLSSTTVAGGSGSVTLTIHANRYSTDGYYTVYIIGTSGSVSHIAAVSVNVESLKTNTP
jgi:uncharacterized protein (DUF58 family)